MPHPVALSGFAAQPERYEAGRPSYPANAVDFVVEQIDPRPTDLIFDVGAGTGKLTRALTGLDVRLVAVEPVFEMARLIGRYAPGVAVIRAAAEDLPVSSGTVAAITVAQAFHWFDSDRAWDEFARVVRPGGVVALMWNARLRETPWVDALWTVMDAVEKHAPWRNHETRESYGDHRVR